MSKKDEAAHTAFSTIFSLFVVIFVPGMGKGVRLYPKLSYLFINQVLSDLDMTNGIYKF